MDEISTKDSKVALLIDADNTSPKYMETVINEITSNYGAITIERAYGDWTTSCLKPWKPIMLKYSLTPMQQFANTSGKNATDSAMIIDAMDILYTKDIDVFCLVTSDSDFTKIASRLRESGKTVIGMGEKKTVPAFISACNKFIYIDIIYEDNASMKDKSDKTKVSSKRLKKSDAKTSVTPIDDIKGSIADLIISKDGSINVGLVKKFLMQKYSDFDERNYGYSKFSTFLNSFDEFILYKNTTLQMNNSESGANITEIKDFVLEAVSVNKSRKSFTSSEIQNIISKKYNNFKLKSLGYSNMRALLKSFEEFDIDSEGKYFLK